MNTPSSTRSFALSQSWVLTASGCVFATAWLGDFLFWNAAPGVSIGIFASIIAAILMITGRRSRAAWIAFALLLACGVQSGIELCFTNLACLGALFFILAGETHYHQWTRGWARWSEAAFAFLTAPLRWGNVVGDFVDTGVAAAGAAGIRAGILTRAIRVAFPAAIVTGIFAILLGAGNDVLREVFTRIGHHLIVWLTEMSFARTALWIVWLTAGIGIFWPSAIVPHARWWTLSPPCWRRVDERIARWQSGLLLVAVNALFFAANTADALFLWAHTHLPAGVNASHFVHEGVHSLIAAVVLAALVLVAVFQQEQTISGSRILKGLALAWIAQNLVLIASVFLRLKLYVDAFQLSELRVYVGCFLLLVCTGFVLLAWQIVRGMNLRHLVFANACATFVLFFILQWCDVGTWVALRNVERWEREPGRALDLAYLTKLGQRGWPALEAASHSATHPAAATTATTALEIVARDERARLHALDWRSYQGRRDQRAAIVARNHNPY